ncbi:MAG: response regulator [Candidatus Obscuribacterales bacterium]|nr:response regulator [Candidatus Obscuribacterales bacterium]
MNLQRTLVFDPDACLRQDVQVALSNHLGLEFDRAQSIEQWHASFATKQPDLVVLDVELPNLSGFELLRQMRSQHWSGPVIFLGSAPIEDLEQTHDIRIDFVRTPIDANELLWRIFKLMRDFDSQPVNKILVPMIQELRNDTSGRLDAELISKTFGITMADIARCIGKTPQAIHKTPDSQSIQSGLFHFERIASGITRATGSVKSLRSWLNTPNPHFDKTCPVEFLQKGKLELLADIVEDALLGQPR